MAEGFPTPGKQLKIINKLNNMAITISQGWHNTKPGFAIVDRSNFPNFQTFKIIQKGNSDVYLIQTPLSDLALSPKSGWGDMVYSAVKFDKQTKQTSQLWRIIPYDDVMYNQKDRQKQIVKVAAISNQGGCKCNSSQSKLEQQNILKLGYEFQSGIHLNYQYDNKNYRQLGMKSMDKNGQKVNNSKKTSDEFDVPPPVRLHIKQKNNILPIDKDTKGWFFIQNVKYNMVLEIQGGIDEPGMNVVLNKLYGNRNQLWKFI